MAYQPKVAVMAKADAEAKKQAKDALLLEKEQLKARLKELGEEIKEEFAVKEFTVSEYKGHRVCNVPMENGNVFTFGQAKARAIVKFIDQIAEFANMPGLEKPEKELHTEKIELRR
jgi:aminopeptidase-like protein